MDQRIDDESYKIRDTNVKAVIENGVRKNSLERTEQGIGDPVKEAFKPAAIVGSCQIERDLQTDYPIAHTKKIIDELTCPGYRTKAWKIKFLGGQTFFPLCSSIYLSVKQGDHFSFVDHAQTGE